MRRNAPDFHNAHNQAKKIIPDLGEPRPKVDGVFSIGLFRVTYEEIERAGGKRRGRLA